MKQRPRESFPPYHFVVTIPDKVYPFKNYIGGRWVRGERSYDAAIDRAYRKYGTGDCGLPILLYREFFHFIGSLGIIYFASLVAYNYFGGWSLLAFVFALAALFLTYQEFILQRRIYRQRWSKAVADWLVWCVPMVLALYLFA